MKLSVFSTALQDLHFVEMLGWLAEQGVQHLELGCGGYPGTFHADAQMLCADTGARQRMLGQLRDSGISLAALSCHGNPLHPDPLTAQTHHQDLMAAIELAQAMQVPVVVCFSGQGGDRLLDLSKTARNVTPNWPVVGWPQEYADLREWQWEHQLIPYWKKMAARAQACGVRLALEMHGGFAVHNPASLLRLRTACGPALGANLDPSHCWWQQIDPAIAIDLLGEALFHVHLKDTRFNPLALARHGVLDSTSFANADERAWTFDLPGEGHDAGVWRSLLAGLENVHYAGVLSIEHEARMPAKIGIPQTLQFMRSLLEK